MLLIHCSTYTLYNILYIQYSNTKVKEFLPELPYKLTKCNYSRVGQKCLFLYLRKNLNIK